MGHSVPQNILEDIQTQHVIQLFRRSSEVYTFVTMKGDVIHEYLHCNIPPFKKLLTSFASPITEMSGKNTSVTESTHCINKARPSAECQSLSSRRLGL